MAGSRVERTLVRDGSRFIALAFAPDGGALGSGMM
jgi:hypothetical protein